MPLPDFTSPTTFPPFTALPLTTTTPQTSDKDKDEHTHYLLAQITQNMTLTKPTLILADRQGTSFALVYSTRPGAGPDTLDLAKLGFKRGATLVVPRARRSLPSSASSSSSLSEEGGGGGDRGGGGKGFVAVEREAEGGVRVIPGAVERVVEVGGWLRRRDEEGEGGQQRGGCESCGKGRGDGDGALMKCTGCGEIAYCSKECQVKGWNEGGHKADCKIIKGIRAIWP